MFGWYCTDGWGPHPRYGSFRPCDPGTPNAIFDMNRLSHFKRTGVDDLYEGAAALDALKTASTRMPRFLYELMWHHLPCGVVERLVEKCATPQEDQPNEELASFAKSLAARLGGG